MRPNQTRRKTEVSARPVSGKGHPSEIRRTFQAPSRVRKRPPVQGLTGHLTRWSRHSRTCHECRGSSEGSPPRAGRVVPQATRGGRPDPGGIVRRSSYDRCPAQGRGQRGSKGLRAGSEPSPRISPRSGSFNHRSVNCGAWKSGGFRQDHPTRKPQKLGGFQYLQL